MRITRTLHVVPEPDIHEVLSAKGGLAIMASDANIFR